MVARKKKISAHASTKRAPARKKRKSPKVIRCGFVETEFLAKGWICCECFKHHGTGTYNGADRDKCKMCGHDRCKGAMKRLWNPPGITPIAVQGSDVAGPGGVLGFLMRALTGAAMRSPSAHRRLYDAEMHKQATANKTPDVSPEWQQACEEVTAATLAAEVHAAGNIANVEKLDLEAMAKNVRDRLPRAREMYEAMHPRNAPPCHCRHMALIFVGAQDIARTTGRDVGELLDVGKRNLEHYLASRS